MVMKINLTNSETNNVMKLEIEKATGCVDAEQSEVVRQRVAATTEEEGRTTATKEDEAAVTAAGRRNER